MAANETQVTRFPGGVGQFTFFAVGGAAGALTATGVRASDKLLLVQSLKLDTGAPNAVADLTSEFTITADNTVNNTGGTATTGAFVAVTVARTKKV
jgi:hypothetical protein